MTITAFIQEHTNVLAFSLYVVFVIMTLFPRLFDAAAHLIFKSGFEFKLRDTDYRYFAKAKWPLAIIVLLMGTTIFANIAGSDHPRLLIIYMLAQVSGVTMVSVYDLLLRKTATDLQTRIEVTPDFDAFWWIIKWQIILMLTATIVPALMLM